MTASPLASSYVITGPIGSVVTSASSPTNATNVLSTSNLAFSVVYPSNLATLAAKTVVISSVNGFGASTTNKTLTVAPATLLAVGTIGGGSTFSRTIQKTITEFKSIIIIGISPPTSSSDHHTCNIHTPNTGGPLPFIGTDSDRKIYTEYMNSLLMNYCLEYGYTYFNPYSFYTREDGMMNRELSDNCVHIGKNAHFLEEFNKLLI
jgi:membrane-associated protease RseP (regulator of RpoE activity)